jgi:hypothetical protein
MSIDYDRLFRLIEETKGRLDAIERLQELLVEELPDDASELSEEDAPERLASAAVLAGDISSDADALRKRIQTVLDVLNGRIRGT